MNPDGSGQTNLTNDSSRRQRADLVAERRQDRLRQGERGPYEHLGDERGRQRPDQPDAGAGRHRPPGFHCRPGPNGQYGITPSWSPSGSEIAYSVSGDIFVMQANGDGKSNITCSNNGQFFEAEPAWSPDGSTIAYRYNSAGVANDIWAMNSDGTNRRPLTATASPMRESFPDWSPDGTEIVYMKSQPAGSIWKMNADGSGQTMLIGGPGEGAAGIRSGRRTGRRSPSPRTASTRTTATTSSS